jgi:tetratricopeptide (TPR) repeat protein
MIHRSLVRPYHHESSDRVLNLEGDVMHRRIIFTIIALASALLIGCGSHPHLSVDEGYKQFKKAIRDVETSEEKSRLCEGFLSQFPQSEHTGDLAEALAYYRGEAMDDPTGAVAFLDDLLSNVQDPDMRFSIEVAQFPLAMKIGQEMDLGAVISDLQAHRPLTFSEHLNVGELAARHDLWNLAEPQAEAASGLATAEAFRAEYPDTDLDDEAVASKAENRVVLAAANRGWALAHLGRNTEALKVFDAAAPLSRSNYLGVPSTGLFSYWGRTALDHGDPERALELLGPNAVLGDDDEALKAFRQAFIEVHDGEAGFEDFLWSTRQKLAKVVDDFELPDYEGALHAFGDTRGKVVFLAFWFPT